jgi:hypothetical protein
MKFSLSLAFVAAFALAACEIDEPPRRTAQSRPVPRYPNAQTSQYPTQPQPFPNEGSQSSAPTTPPEDPAATTAQSAPPAPSAPPTAKGDYPYGVPVEGKPGFVRSPYSPDKMTDVRGYAPGTEVKDPYTQKIFLVP